MSPLVKFILGAVGAHLGKVDCFYKNLFGPEEGTKVRVEVVLVLPRLRRRRGPQLHRLRDDFQPAEGRDSDGKRPGCDEKHQYGILRAA